MDCYDDVDFENIIKSKISDFAYIYLFIFYFERNSQTKIMFLSTF